MRIWPFGRKETAKPSKRMYGGAQFGRLVSDWVAQSTSIDSEIRMSLRTLRNRSRQLCRDNEFARNAIRAITNNVIGKGVGLQMQVKMQRQRTGGPSLNESINEQIETAWAAWCKKENCHVGGTLSFEDIERLLVSSVAESGEVLIRMVKQPFGSSKVPFALEIIESDQLIDERNGHADNGNEIRMGVERDTWGRPVQYWFYPRHPGDYQFQSVQPAKYKTIVADEIVHLFKVDRVGQTRGVPWMTPALKRLHQISGYEEAEVIRARAEASIMGFIQTPDGELQDDGVQDNQRVTDFSPGKIEALGPGEQFNPFVPNRAGNQYEPFMRTMLRAVAAGIGVSYEAISKDYSQSNYSSSRLALLDDRDQWRVLQSWMIENFHQRVFCAWLEMAVMSGELKLPRYELDRDMYESSVKWLPRGWSWVDPTKEVQAYKEAVRSGFMTQADVISQSGGDLEEFLVNRKREVELAESMGLVFDTDAGQVTAKGDAQTTVPTNLAEEESSTDDGKTDAAIAATVTEEGDEDETEQTTSENL